MIRVEHVAFQMELPREAAAWYVEHLGCRILRGMDEPPFAHFLTDAAGAAVLEIYRNPDAPLPDYRAMNMLELHLAFVVLDFAAEYERLLAAGASEAEPPFVTDSGDRIGMLRDPWGFPLQLVQRQVALR